MGEYPQNATGLGIDRDQRAGLESRLTDRSPDGQKAIAQRARARLKRLQAIEWFATTNGSGLEEVTSEVDRYCAWPGQACGYKVGHSEINRLRTKARAELGARYDLRLFDDAVVKGGDVPMVVLARNIDAFIKQRK